MLTNATHMQLKKNIFGSFQWFQIEPIETLKWKTLDISFILQIRSILIFIFQLLYVRWWYNFSMLNMNKMCCLIYFTIFLLVIFINTKAFSLWLFTVGSTIYVICSRLTTYHLYLFYETLVGRDDIIINYLCRQI